ncbi:MAG: hypothetical protein KC505_01765 [Myxococcales bacterium]|nr:hypothetical protein [Myxococcales bacterium]USN51473.1 MAG: hypothetical protein H6731_03435 [Myxococcales bacterium]
MRSLLCVFLFLFSCLIFCTNYQCDNCNSCDFVCDIHEGDCICKECGMIVDRIIVQSEDEKENFTDD